MAPIKFEENIKEKLEKRTLEPSSQAWNVLSEKLHKDSKQSSNKTIWWFGVAASLVGVLIMVNLFFNTSETDSYKPVLGDTEAKEIKNIQDVDHVKPEDNIVAVEDMHVVSKTILNETTDADKKSKISKNQIVKNTNITEVVPLHEPDEKTTNSNLEVVSEKTELTQVAFQENSNKTETDIDALLKKAQQNLADNKKNEAYSIDAQSLLQDVEEDLDESFRNKVFETLKTNFKKVKTAVAERND
ncbi:hypothetical protein DI383_11270 [Flavobacteriaceae bacterium LYZ1037]|nr:hypothetical protein DI383_11270 [Flavobacteriaceae bacterium LYZ1037]